MKITTFTSFSQQFTCSTNTNFNLYKILENPSNSSVPMIIKNLSIFNPKEIVEEVIVDNILIFISSIGSYNEGNYSYNDIITNFSMSFASNFSSSFMLCDGNNSYYDTYALTSNSNFDHKLVIIPLLVLSSSQKIMFAIKKGDASHDNVTCSFSYSIIKFI